MPREAIALGAAQEVLPLERMAAALLARVNEITSRATVQQAERWV